MEPQAPQVPNPQAVTPPVPQPDGQPVAPLAPQPFQPDQPAKRRIPRWVKIIGVIVAVLVVLFVIALVVTQQTTKQAQKISDQFVADLQKDDAPAAYRLTTSSFQKSNTESSLEEVFGQVSGVLQGKAGVSGRAINKNSGQPNQATILYTVNTKSGKKYIRLILQDNSNWQVLDFRSSDTPLSLSGN